MTLRVSRRRFLAAAAVSGALLDPGTAPAGDLRALADSLEAELRRVYRQIDPRMDARVWIKWDALAGAPDTDAASPDRDSRA
jgi:hypothetical protein